MADAKAQLEAFIDRFLPRVAATGTEAVARLRARLPQADVLVYDNYNALAVGFAPNDKTSNAILSIAFYPRWVSLFFLQGAGMADPDGLLKGSGNTARHIVLDDASDLDTPGVSALIDRALETARVPLDPNHEGRLIIKSVSANQRPRRPAGF